MAYTCLLHICIVNQRSDSDSERERQRENGIIMKKGSNERVGGA